MLLCKMACLNTVFTVMTAGYRAWFEDQNTRVSLAIHVTQQPFDDLMFMYSSLSLHQGSRILQSLQGTLISLDNFILSSLILCLLLHLPSAV